MAEREFTENAEIFRERIDALLEQIGPILDGHNQLVLGCVISELTAVWVAGFRPSIQADMFKLHIDYTRSMIAEESAAIWEDDEIVAQ